MKLKTRLVVSFCVILFVPIFLMGLVMMTIGGRQLRALEGYAKRLENYYAQDQINGEEKSEYGYLKSEEAFKSDREEYEGNVVRIKDESLADAISDVPSTARLMPEMRHFILNMGIVIMMILVITASLLLVWIYTGINVPLNNLRKATKNIAEGNLNFTLDVSGDDEISDLCRDFETMRKRLLESTEAKMQYDRENKELISNISHDLKTPITAIKGYVEGIMDGVADTPEKMDRYIRTIYNKTNDMDRLINELTFYSKIDTNRIPYTFNKINVNGYFEDCVEEIGLDLESEGIEFVYHNEVEPHVEIIADAEQLKRVVDNIVGNAVKYMDKKPGKISMTVKDVGDFVQVEIEDNGKGIGPKELPFIFDRFYRTDASRNSSQGGSGIGLSIVKKIMEDHGGKIWASSKLGSGTVMYFVLRKYQEVPV